MDTVVSPAWLADDDGAVVVDVRDAWEFDGIGHVPGAVNIPFDSFRGDDGEAGKLPGAAVFAALVEEAGIDNEDTIVAYDDHHGVFAARFLVTAELYGHDPDKLALLDGDFTAWQREYETTSEATVRTPTEYEARFDTDGPLIEMHEVREAIEAGATLVDTREQDEYDEGHIEGAVRLNWRAFVDDETRGLKPESELREILSDRGVDPEDHVVLYCNTARRVSHTYTVLRQLGYDHLSFYEGSLAEWEREGGELIRT
ncbi:sulfurtransferase [Halosegnis longus]|uniref:sulfurtransferase n=1 Tax=Halosegnis longus TaxID=2216012 RepID=UPI00096A5A80|nr:MULTISPECIES: rhodanese-like domain-containing protein [Halobacteriales]